MTSETTRKNLIVVHSIKGGCGKTTISLALAQYFALLEPEKQTCYIDTDLVGVGTNVLAGERIDEKKSFTDFVLLNPFDNREFFKHDFEDNHRDMFYKEFVYEPDANRNFHAIFSSVEKKITEKAIRATNDLFFAEDVKSKIKVLLDKLFYPGNNNSMDTIILDTTPGLQGITGIILDLAKEYHMDELTRNDNAYKIAKKKSKDNNGNKDLRVLFLVVSTNNFSHIRSLCEYLYGEKDTFLESNNKAIPYLLVLNQIPMGAEFNTLPDPSIYIPKDELARMKDGKNIDANRLEDFEKCLRTDLIGEGVRQDRVTKAFYLYHSVREKNYLKAQIKESKTDLYEKTIIIPDHPPLRTKAANFGDYDKFSPPDYFNLLQEANKGIMLNLGEQVKSLLTTNSVE